MPAGHQQQRAWAGVLAVLGQFINSVVGEEGMRRINTSSRKTARGGNEHPVVGAAHQAHKEGRHGREMLYLVERFPQQVNVFSLNFLFLVMVQSISNKNRGSICAHYRS
ncbi:hypothetical protein SDC9_135454 [bioreactor metagenome]|uniref:Uncharacterized protein n=1 Tax=bioreactor metagenome TaxID=1076179 RepID=A0A645DIC9_9ZZZZ